MRSVRVLKNILTNYLRFFLTGLIGLVLTIVSRVAGMVMPAMSSAG